MSDSRLLVPIISCYTQAVTIVRREGRKDGLENSCFFIKKTRLYLLGVNSKHEIEAALLPYTYLAISLSENNIRPCQLLHAFVTPFFFTYDLFSCFLYTGKMWGFFGIWTLQTPVYQCCRGEEKWACPGGCGQREHQQQHSRVCHGVSHHWDCREGVVEGRMMRG